MSKSTKNQRLREKMQADVKRSKQTTLGSMSKLPEKEIKTVDLEKKKRIAITGIDTLTKEEELALKVGFRLFPSRIAFSKVTADLYFDDQKLNSTRISILQGPLATEDSEFTSVLNMKGINAGSHAIKVEMYELWSSGERLSSASKEVTVEYVPIRKEDRLIKIPTVKRVAGTDLEVVSDSEKDIYRELNDDMKKELNSKRDEW